MKYSRRETEAVRESTERERVRRSIQDRAKTEYKLQVGTEKAKKMKVRKSLRQKKRKRLKHRE